MSDKAEQVAFDPAAPRAEQIDALTTIQREHMPSTSDLVLPPGEMRRVIQEAVLDLQDDPMFFKSVADNVVPFPSDAAKRKARGMQSVIIDENQINVMGDYWERPSVMSFDALRNMVTHTPVLNAVVMTRVRQCQRFCRVAEKGNDAPGFEIRHADRAHGLTGDEQKSIQLLNRFILNNGWEFKPRLRKSLHRDNLSGFMGKSVRDALTMDSAPIELEWKRNQNLGLDGFYAIDGATMRLCTEQGYRGDDEIFALQVVQGAVRAAYTHSDLIYEPRNPRTDVNGAGYGISETELLVRTATGFLNAMTYNIRGFDTNSIPKGMLHLAGNYDDNDIRAFRRYWNAMVKGVNNAWVLPVMVSKDQDSRAAFEKFGADFNEMHFAKWMSFLASIICALFGMSPTEINFDSFSGTNTSALSGDDTSERLAQSKDSGLRPLLAHYENVISDYVVAEFSDDLVFRWTGLDPEDAQAKQEMRKLILTVNEARAEEGKEKMKGPLGDAPLNPTLVQPWMQISGFNDPPPGAEGAPGDAGDGGGDTQDGADPEAQAANDPNAFGTSEDDDAQFGKAFNLPPIFKLEDLV